MKTKKLLVNTGQEKYSIIIGSKLISNLRKIIKSESINFIKCLIIADKNVPKEKINLIKDQLNNKDLYIYYIKANEKNKNQRTTSEILEILLRHNFSKEDVLISVGGGITGDVAGYAASLFKRGLKFINIPTTLLAQVDSSIGGKTGVNTKYGKNLIGTFYQPKLVITDTDFLNTLPKREIICGYGEILKHSLICDKKLFQFLNKNLGEILQFKSPYIQKTIYESCKIKKRVVEKDEKEKNIRKILNFGHTFAHAIEVKNNYSKNTTHGEAVLVGMILATKLSVIKKACNQKVLKEVLNIYKANNLDYILRKYKNVREINSLIPYLKNDKKNNDEKINFILINRIGKTAMPNKHKISINELKRHVKYLTQY